MTATERQREIMNALVMRRHDSVACLAAEFGTNERTIRRDIQELSLMYPIETAPGPHGGVMLADWYRPGRKVLAREQIDAIREAARFLEGEQKQALLSILAQFTAP